MIAKIGRGANMMGALAYNQLKVEKENGQILATQRIMETPDGQYTVAQLHRSFEPYFMANKRTEKPVLHISLNPDPADRVSDAQFVKMAQEYMGRLANSRISFLSIPILNVPIFISYLPVLTVTAKRYPIITKSYAQWKFVEHWSKNTISYLPRKNSIQEMSRYSVRWITEPETLRAKSLRWCDTCRSIIV